MSFGALSGFGVPPHPALRKHIIGYSKDRVRLPIYIGMSPTGARTYLLLPNDRSFLCTILLEGPSGSGKSITMRNIIENLFMEWKIYGASWRHPIICFDWKANYLGLDKPNRRRRDHYLLQQHGIDRRLAIPSNLINVYCPAYVAPTTKKQILKNLTKRWEIQDLWGVPWRQIIDLAHLGKVLKVPMESMWSEELRPFFEKASINPDMTLRGLIGVNGYLTKAAKHIRNPSTRNAAINFVLRWRKNSFWFRNRDKLAQHLNDPFSINILTFVQCPEKIYFNQLAFMIALESLMTTLQNSKAECQPVIVIHDILNWIGEGKPFRNEILDSLTRLLAGQARSLAHGYIVVIETQSLKAMPDRLNDPKKYTIALRFNWKSQSSRLRKVSGFIGGVCSVHNNFLNFHRPSVIVRPPLTSYET